MWCSSAATAQKADTARRPEPLFTWGDAWVAAGVMGATAALIPFDPKLSDVFMDLGPHKNSVTFTTSKIFDQLGNPGAVVVSLGTYVVGRIAGQDRLADLGLHTSEALLLSSVETLLAKGIVGRNRPFLNPSDASNFRFGRGFGSDEHDSFPSGHTSAAFAAAAAINHETRHWWPHRPLFVGPLLYAGAGLVAVARVYGSQHWPSDVIMGALIGTSAGIKVVRYNHTHPRNRIDRWLGAIALSPS